MAAIETGTVFIGIEGNVKPLELSLKRANRDLSTFRAKTNKSLAGVDRAFGGLGRSVKNLTRSFGRMLPALVGVAGVAGLGLLVKSSLDAADSIAKTSDALGLSTDALQEWRHVAEIAGVSAAQIDKGMKGFAARLGEARVETGTLVTVLKRMDPALLAALQATTDTDQAMKLIFKSMDKFTNATDKAALSATAFGRRAGVAMTVIGKDGSEAIDKLRQSAHDLGIVLEESLIRGAETAKDRMYELGQVISIQLTKIILENADAIAAAAKALALWVVEASKFLGLIKESDLDRLNDMTQALRSQAQTVSNLFDRPAAQDVQLQIYVDQLGRVLALRKEIARTKSERDAEQLNVLMNKPGPSVAAPTDKEIAAAERTFATITRMNQDATMGQIELIKLREMKTIAALDKIKGHEQQKQNAIVEIHETANAKMKVITDRRVEEAKRAAAELTVSEEIAKRGAEEMGEALNAAFVDSIIQGEKFGDVLRNLLGEMAKIVLKMIEAQAIDMWESSRNTPEAPSGSSGFGNFFSSLFGTSGSGGSIPIGSSGGFEAAGSGVGIGYAHGGSFKVGGVGAPDSQQVSFRATPGERVTIGDDTGGGVVVNQTVNISTGVQQTVRVEMANMMPRIKEAAVDAVMEARMRGGAMAAVFAR